MTVWNNKAKTATVGDVIPLYSMVKAHIRKRIESGVWPPRHRVPSETEIVAEFGVSRMTANRALKELADEGVIVRVQGLGSFVAVKKGSSGAFEVRNIAEEIKERGHAHTVRILFVREEKASASVAADLGVHEHDRVFHSLMVHSENGVPIQLEDRFVNPAVAPRYPEQDFQRVTPNAYLVSIAPLTHVEQFVEAIVPRAWEAKELVVRRSVPCLMIGRRTWSDTLNVTSVRLVYPGSRYRLEGGPR